MTSAEFENLQRRELSHQARSLYIFYLRPKAIMGTVTVDLYDISNALISNSQFLPFNANDVIANQVLLELERANFIRRTTFNEYIPDSFQACTLTFPYIEHESTMRPNMPFLMHKEWRPGPSYQQAAFVAGLEDMTFSERELQGFISYWQNKNETRNQLAWERAFVQRLLRQRRAHISSFKSTKKTQAPDFAPIKDPFQSF